MKPPEPPGKVEATALAIAGPAFAASLIVLRDATALQPGLFDGAAALCVALGVAPWVHRTWGAFAATGVRGAGLVLGALLCASALVPPFYSAVAPATIAIVGGTLLQGNARREKQSATIEGGGVALLAAAFIIGLIISPSFPEPGRLRLTLLLSAIAVTLGLALRRTALATSHGEFAPMPVGILLVSTLGGAYLGYRALVQQNIANLPIYEWTLAASAAALLLARLRRNAKERETADAWSGDARRHAQDVRPVYDDRMAPLAAAVGRWLERGDGFEEYQAALAAQGIHVPDSIAVLNGGRGRSARREAAAQRLAAHGSLLRPLQRGPPHGNATEHEPRLR
ncbi:MAG: hypothetical protein WDA16_11430 [Candidatus Thermoplasmatota archaeon]